MTADYKFSSRRRFKHYACKLIYAIIWLLPCACSNGESEIERRRVQSVATLQQKQTAAQNLFQEVSSKRIIDAIQSANATTLKRAQVAFAALVKESDGRWLLHLTWVENRPSVREAILTGVGNKSIKVDISERELAE